MNSASLILLSIFLASSPTIAFQDQDNPKPVEPATDTPKPDEKPSDSGDKPADSPAEKPGEKPTEKIYEKKDITPPVAPAPKVEVPDSPAKAILRHAAEVVKNANALSFKVKLYGEGGMLSGAPALEADEKMLRAPGSPNTWLIRASGSGSIATANREGAAAKTVDPSAFDIVWTPNSQSWIEHSEKIVYTRPLNAIRGKSTQTASSARLRYFNLPTPFQKELQPAEFTQEDSATVNGELCDVISTKGDRGSHDRYSISQKDGFPRRIEKVFDSERIKGRYVTDFTDVRINPSLSEEQFHLAVPDGYKEDIQLPKPPSEETKGEAVKSAEPTAPTDTNTAASAPAPIVPVLDSAPDIDLPLNSGVIKLSSLKGNVVVLDFFGTWALTAKGEHDELKKLQDKFKDKPFKVLSFAVREKNPDAATDYLSRNQFTWDLAKRGDPVGAALGVKTYPYWILLDQAGHIKYRSLAGKSELVSKLDDAISDCLGVPRTTPSATTTEPAKDSTPPAPPATGSTGAVEPTDVKK